MADDIEIEEHDVLENPIIKSIFPDISALKKEIAVYYEDGKIFGCYKNITNCLYIHFT